MFVLYRALNILLTPFIRGFLLYRVLKKKESKSRLSERFGLSEKSPECKRVIWVHASSVGELLSAVPTINYLAVKKNYTILVTTCTLASAQVFEKVLKLPNVIHRFVPVESYFAIKRFLKIWKPELAIFVESEFWPLLIHYTSKSCRLISFNTVISDQTFTRWKIINKLFVDMLSKFSLFMPQSKLDEERLHAFGMKKNVIYLGHLKYSVPLADVKHDEYESLKNAVGSRDVILCASTHHGEEEILVHVFRSLKDPRDPLLVIAPRHPMRAPQIISLLERSKLNFSVRSRGDAISDSTQVYLADTIGEMPLFFKLAKVTILGGTFVKGIGGHNPVEAAKAGSVLILGPYAHGFREIYAEFYEKKAAIPVSSERECGKAITLLLSNDKVYKTYVANAAKLLASKKHMLEKSRQYLDKFVQ